MLVVVIIFIILEIWNDLIWACKKNEWIKRDW